MTQCQWPHLTLARIPNIPSPFLFQPRMTMARTIKLYKLPDETATPGLRRMRPEDVPQVSVGDAVKVAWILDKCGMYSSLAFSSAASTSYI